MMPPRRAANGTIGGDEGRADDRREAPWRSSSRSGSSGASAQVATGEAVGLIAGDPEAVARAADLLDAVCPRRFLLGKVGHAGRAKLAVNLVLGLNRLALAEGLVFAERLGLDPAAFLP